MNHGLAMVRCALALHLGMEPDTFHERQRLDEDLGLDPLDLVLIVLRLEELEHSEFPVGDLEGVRTVADLVAIVHEWSPSREPRRTESGIRPRVCDDPLRRAVAS